ncbi:GNAT family N-acetyltransferase [Methanococcoides burtonii]|uniref:N-acetyltransferase domain-containing protein n=1 Tax=Methanococcoides burtonii (strain DSM 6242 / NBRC 107633 / OCM 468 / ACE-M) TaxID=259564 RepID=Q12Z74_METBU|nr:GNAT family N-acetyltransferase [Methanococcoides burtonii]ABE51252.1 Hypothetical protein with N-acetyltransferase domain [Methanococcoides burtonii DSM 6242]
MSNNPDGYGSNFTIDFEDIVHLIMVDVDLQRESIGSQLLVHSGKELSGHGATTLHVETFEINNQAVNFYKKNDCILTRKQKEQGLNINRLLFENATRHNDDDCHI